MYILEGRYNKAIIQVHENTVLDEATTTQIYSFLNHPAFVGEPVVIMPDAHKGVGSCIGFTMPLNEYIIPGVIGVDINCGIDGYNLGPMKLALQDFIEFDNFIKDNIPSGFSKRDVPLDRIPNKLISEIEAISNELGLSTEGVLKSLGTLGGGNHFIELNRDPDSNIWVVVHTGSRHFGYKICEYHRFLAKNYMKVKHTGSTYQGLEYFEISEEKEHYIAHMKVAQKYAQLNRDLIVEQLITFFGKKPIEVIKTAHNYLNLDDSIVRKGAISAQKGERVLIPLNMADGIVVGTGKGNAEWNYSAPHGAGRLLSRKQAKSTLLLADAEKRMEKVFTTSLKTSTLDEAPDAYKNAEDILSVIDDTVEVDFVMKPIFNYKDS